MPSIDCCNNFINPLARMANFTDDGDGLMTMDFEFASFEGGGTQNCGSGVHLTFSKPNGTFFGGFTFPEGSDIDTFEPASNAVNWSVINPHVSGVVTNGGTMSINSLELMKDLGLFNGAVGGDSVSLEIGVYILDCVTNELSNNPDNKITITEIFEPPVSKIENQLVLGGASGVISYDLSLKEFDDTTPLQAGDLVKITFKDGTEILEVLEGVYGTDISLMNIVENNNASSVTLWSTGTVQDGSTINFARKDWSVSNGYFKDEVNDTLVDLNICVESFDGSQCSFNENLDNNINLETIKDIQYSALYFADGGSANVLGYQRISENAITFDRDGIDAYHSGSTFGVIDRSDTNLAYNNASQTGVGDFPVTKLGAGDYSLLASTNLDRGLRSLSHNIRLNLFSRVNVSTDSVELINNNGQIRFTYFNFRNGNYSAFTPTSDIKTVYKADDFSYTVSNETDLNINFINSSVHSVDNTILPWLGSSNIVNFDSVIPESGKYFVHRVVSDGVSEINTIIGLRVIEY